MISGEELERVDGSARRRKHVDRAEHGSGARGGQAGAHVPDPDGSPAPPGFPVALTT